MGSHPDCFFSVFVLVPPAFFNLSFSAVWSWCCFVPSCVFVRGGGVRSPGEFGVLVHPSLGKSVMFVCVILLMVAQLCTQLGSLALKHKKNLPDAGKGSVVCSSLYCGTRYLIAVLASPTAQVPRWVGNVSGGAGSVLGGFGILVYPPSGIARQSHCTPAILSIVMSFGHCTDHCTTGSVAGGA